eukprot:COSAG04_NODE_110_length_25928_cov_18.966782_28_plen_94_part_00
MVIPAADELALLVTYYRVTAANISSVEINRDLTLRETRGAFTDFRRLAFTITTEAGDVVSVEADRCVPSFSMSEHCSGLGVVFRLAMYCKGEG